MRDWPETRRARLAIALIALTGFGFTLWIFYPGVTTFDSFYVYKDMANRAFGDWQSPVMLALWMLVDPVAPGTGSLLLLTAVLYWVSFALIAGIIAARSPRLALVLPLLGFSPPAFVLLGVIWRDILFGISWLLAAGLVFAVARKERRIRLPIQLASFVVFAFGFLLRPNALAAAPLLAAYLAWPAQFRWRRAALLYIPAVLALFALVQIIYYGVFQAERQHPLQSIMVFDLGGISHFSGENVFPGEWTPEQSRMIVSGCYKPIAWDIYWTQEPCLFVMQRLEEEEKLFGTPAIGSAWLKAVAAHPLAYLEHRSLVEWTFLAGKNLALWSRDLDDPDKIIFADKPRLMALKSVNDALNETPLFRAGTWLLLDLVLCSVVWRRRGTPTGAFVLGTCGSAAVYLLSFWAVGVSTDLRYAYWAILAGLTGVIAAAHRPSKDELALHAACAQ
jgi:hypothetical protein